MGRLILMSIIILLFAEIVYAWGPVTHNHICREASNKVWGLNITNSCFIQNFNYMARLCDAAEDIEDKESYERCIDSLNKNIFINPSIMPDVIFNDANVGQYLDRNSKEMKANMWFEAAIYRLDTCSSIQEFCIGSHYFADSLYPFDYVDYSIECAKSFDSDVDKKITDGIKNWEIRLNCFQQEFVVTDEFMDNVISNLTEIGNFIQESQKNITTEIETFANETLVEFQQEFYGLIGKENITAIREREFNTPMLLFAIFIVVIGIFTIIYVTIKTKHRPFSFRPFLFRKKKGAGCPKEKK